jgi:ABC-type antimicrobial peptide transport system permease subunit
VGAGIGIILSVAATKVVRNILFGFIPLDPVSFGTGLVLFGVVALAASIVPARRALRIDPSSALRYE